MQINDGRMFIGRFKYKEDLLESITNFCKKEDIKLGVFSIIGALTCCKLGYYNQEAKKYVECANIDKRLEIASCTGNISLLNSEIFIHAHISVGDLTGTSYGGHLMPGAVIFVAEYYIKELKGELLHRAPDPDVGLNLWQM
jgi:predicted DNA-binding protein with PD1-like motif